jgi:hypothetical protein
VNACLRLSTAAIFAIAAQTALATSDLPCGDNCLPTPWLKLNAIAVKVSFPGSAKYEILRGRFDSKTNDFRLDAELFDGKAAKKGTILLVGGLVMAVKGNVADPGAEFNLLDNAALSQQLVYRLLGVALPNGPESAGDAETIDFASRKTALEVSTPSSEGVISPPWRVTGTIKRVADDEFEYDLKLTSGLRGKGAGNGRFYNPHLSGRLSKVADAKLDDATPLNGWKTYGVGVVFEGPGNSAPAPAFHTVADVRARLAGEDAGVPDTSRDFTGLWKEQCEDEFGLRIGHEGDDGKYLIIFCGPGGCEDPDNGRRTFITGDRNYQIIDDNELVQTGEQGGRQRYRRCGKGGHPSQG